jgi:VWFA-related protein
MRWIKCWPKTARRDSLRHAGLLCFAVALLSAAAIPQETTLRSQSNVVLIPALVKDAQGGIVYGLQAKDFIVEDDGVEQPVRLDEEPEGHPISLVIAIQVGRRANYEFPRIQRLNSMLEPIVEAGNAKVAVLEFDSQVHPIHDFTGNAQRVTQDLQDLQPGDGGAVILDAIAESIKLLEKAPKERPRVLLLISETRDHGSGAKIEDVVAAMGQSNTVIYALAFSPSLSNILDTGRGNNKNEMNAGPDLLGPLLMAAQAMRKNTPKTIAAMTGGEYEMFETRKKFEVRVNDFTNHLHSRYQLSITPKDPHPGLHELRVRLRNNGSNLVLARSSYWAGGTN